MLRRRRERGVDGSLDVEGMLVRFAAIVPRVSSTDKLSIGRRFVVAVWTRLFVAVLDILVVAVWSPVIVTVDFTFVVEEVGFLVARKVGNDGRV